MNSIRSLLMIALALLGSPMLPAADEGEGAAAAKPLEKQILGYWAPDQAAMMKFYTEEAGMKKEDADKLIGESAGITVHNQKGMVHLFTKQGVLSVPYEILKTDKATRSLTVGPKNKQNGPKPEAIEVMVTGDQITVKGGQIPFFLKRIGEEEFKKLKKDLPSDPVGP